MPFYSKKNKNLKYKYLIQIISYSKKINLT